MKFQSDTRAAGRQVLIRMSALVCGLFLTNCAGSNNQTLMDRDELTVILGGVPFATVHMGASPKPFVYPLYAASGVPLTRGYPMEQHDGEQTDHPHHQSLWFAHGSVNGFDFWHSKHHDERIVWDGESTLENGSDHVRVVGNYAWTVEDGAVLCTERRELLFAENDGTRTLDVTVTLTPVGNDLVLGDTKEGTFALRVHPALRVDGEIASGVLTNSEGRSGKDVWGKRARWIDDSGVVEGERVGLAMFDHPSNPRHPTWWQARNYGLLAANPFGLHDFEGAEPGSGEMTVPLGQTLQLRYRVLLHGADWDPQRIDAAYNAWITE